MENLNPYLITAVLFALLAAGIIYNQIINWIQRHEYDEGLSVFAQTVLGVAICLIGLAIIDWRSALLAFLCFSAAGAPIAIGSLIRDLHERKQSKEAIRTEIMHTLTHGHET